MRHLSKNEVGSLFDQIKTGNVYQKIGTVLTRPAVDGEMVVTVVNGLVETINTVVGSDYSVIKNLAVGTSGEEYVVKTEKMLERYNSTESFENTMHNGYHWAVMQPTGKVTGATYTGQTITFNAPWGESMLLEAGDFLATPYPMPRDYKNDIYRIEKGAFYATYQPDG